MRAVVIGAGASGLMCAALLARGGADVTVIERNSKAGKKLFITGKGRCNLTNDCDVSEWLASTVNGAKFLYSAAHAFPPSAVKDYFESIGLRLKTERGKRVFPCSDKSSDVIKALVRDCERGGVKFLFDKRVTAIETDGGRAVGVRAGQELYFADAVVVATGGVTYPSTGSTGDGCAFARSLDLKVVDPKPSLVPLRTNGTGSLSGLALKNVRFDVEIGGKVVASEFGEMQFERGAVTGPIVLTCSALTCKYRDENGLFPSGSKGIVDFKPALDEATLDARLLREFSSAPTAKLKVVAQKLLPSAAVSAVLGCARADGEKRASDVDKATRRRIVAALKNFDFSVVGAEGAEQAIVTSGGVATGELDPKTMQCKKVGGLYFVGEVIDVDSLTGGFNLQNAWATAASAARAICEKRG